MAMPLLSSFRLVGGTALSLLKGHRESLDIDLFTDKTYGTTDFGAIEKEIKKSFPFVENPDDEFPAIRALENNKGLHLIIGMDKENPIKTDILYWEDFLFNAVETEGIRMARGRGDWCNETGCCFEGRTKERFLGPRGNI